MAKKGIIDNVITNFTSRKLNRPIVPGLLWMTIFLMVDKSPIGAKMFIVNFGHEIPNLLLSSKSGKQGII